MVHRLLLPQGCQLPGGGHAVSQEVVHDSLPAVFHAIVDRLWRLNRSSQREYQEACLGRDRLAISASSHLQDYSGRCSEHNGLRFDQVYLSNYHLASNESYPYLRRASVRILDWRESRLHGLLDDLSDSNWCHYSLHWSRGLVCGGPTVSKMDSLPSRFYLPYFYRWCDCGNGEDAEVQRLGRVLVPAILLNLSIAHRCAILSTGLPDLHKV